MLEAKSIEHARVGFAFSTKDRVDFTRRSLRSIDQEGGYDLVWCDGSNSVEGLSALDGLATTNASIVERHRNVRGGPDAAIRYGLRRLLALGYDYCGLIENDIEFEAGWFTALKCTMRHAHADGLRVGAVTCRTIDARVLSYRAKYAVLWNMGAGMVLFSREAAKLILAGYGCLPWSAIRKYYLANFGVDLAVECGMTGQAPGWFMPADMRYAMQLYRYGLSSVGSIPTVARNMDGVQQPFIDTDYVIAPRARPTHVENAVHKKISNTTQDAAIISRVRIIGDHAGTTLAPLKKKYRTVRRILEPRQTLRNILVRAGARS